MKFSRELPKDAKAVRHRPSPIALNKRRLLLYVGFVFLDVLAVIGAFEAGGFARYGDFHWHAATDAVVVTLPIYILIAFNNGACSIDSLRRAQIGIVRSAAAMLFAFTSLLFISYYFRIFQFEPRSATGVGMIGRFVLLVLLRAAYGRFVTSSWATG